MSETFVYRIEARLKRLGHHIGWNTRGSSLRHGSCSHCGQHVSLESQQGFHRATGEALDRSCALVQQEGDATQPHNLLALLS
jgi:hypothetical protein